MFLYMYTCTCVDSLHILIWYLLTGSTYLSICATIFTPINFDFQTEVFVRYLNSFFCNRSSFELASAKDEIPVSTFRWYKSCCWGWTATWNWQGYSWTLSGTVVRCCFFICVKTLPFSEFLAFYLNKKSSQSE